MVVPLKVERGLGVEPEALFMERYEKMLQWSLQLTSYDRELAEDLVHDLFIQFVLNMPDPSCIDNLDGYLYITLRNLHIARQRRANRNRLVQLSIVEYDSALIGLSKIDFTDQLAAQDELRRVCLYACGRKEHAKVASVLILRFFHGYYPDEITRVAGSPRAAIDKWLNLARGEAKASLSNDPKVSFIVPTELPPLAQTDVTHHPADLLEEMRETIFRSREGKCYDARALRSFYPADVVTPLECSTLAHIVSCPSCLDGVNRLLGIALLSERRATETLGRDPKKDDGDKGGGGTGGSGGDMTDPLIGKLRRRVKDTFTHKPQELCVAVNGYALGSHLVSAERSELNLVVERPEDIDFVEIYTEQKVRLLMHNIEARPPAGPGERSAIVRLSDERLLELSLRFTSPSPTIQVVYLDPTWNAAQEWDDAIEIASHPVEAIHKTDPGLLGLNAEEIELPKNAFRRMIESVTTGGFWLRPATLSVILSAMILGAAIYLNWGPTAPPTLATAREVLKQAGAMETALAARTDLVIHRSIDLEERNPATNELRSRRRIDIWQGGEQRATAERLFDEQGRLIAGEFTRDGNRTLYKKHATNAGKSGTSNKQSAPEDTTIAANAAWQAIPTARNFEQLVGSLDRAKMTDAGDRYVINYGGGGAATTNLVRATLVVSKSDLRPIEQTLTVRRGGPNAGDDVTEYRFVETAFEQRAPNTVAPSVFEPDAELLVPDATVVTQKVDETSPTDPINANANTATAPSAIATADLEVEVLRLLNGAGADIDDQTDVSRTADGKLLVTGLVETKERKNEILRALTSVAHNPALVIRVETYAEAAARQKQTTPGQISIQNVEVANDRIAVFDEVSRRIGSSDEAAVQRFSAGVLNRSRSVMSLAGALKKLAGRFSRDDLKNMTPEARSKWLAMVRTSARNVEAEARRLRLEIQSVFYPGAGANAGDGAISVGSDDELQQAAARLFAETAANDRVIRTAFTISTDGSSGAAIRNAGFVSQLARVEGLAASLQKVK